MYQKILICFLFFLTTIIAENTTLTILHTNDCHGHLLSYDIPGQKNVGGMAARMTFIKEVRQEIAAKKSHLLLLDCGDINTGAPLSDMFAAEPDIKLMNAMGYDALGVGNHEFDLKLEKLRLQQKAARFPYLSANIVNSKTGKLLFTPWILKKIKNTKIAIFGMTTEDTPLISTHGNDADIAFIPPHKVLPGLIKQLRSKADYIIGIMHISHGRVKKLAKKFPGIDMIIGGHTHLTIPKPVKIGKTLLVEAGAYGLLVGKFDLVFSGQKLQKWDYQLVGMNLSAPLLDSRTKKVLCYPYKKKFVADAGIKKILAPYVHKAQKLLDQPIGVTTKDILPLKRTQHPHSSPLGNMITDSFRLYGKADIALQNVGGIRGAMVKGKIVYRDIKRILPFANTLVVFTVSGTQVVDILNAMVQMGPSSGRFFEVSGIKLTIQGKKLLNATIHGQPIHPNKKYRLATNSFIARGGDGYKIFETLTQKQDTGFFLADIFARYIKKHTPLTPKREIRFQWLTKKVKGSVILNGKKVK